MEAYVVLKVIWAVLLGVLLSGLAVFVGMDMGVGSLLRFVGKTDNERRTALKIIGPHWDGNQVWFILGGGAIFAAFPTLYASSFSLFYIVMILLLFSMIMRPVAFEYRSKVDAKHWRATWDWAFLISGAVPMIVYGAAFGNVMEGIGFHFGWDGQYYRDESFIWYLLNPFAILCGVMALALSIQQGGTILMVKGVEPIYGRARRIAIWGGIIGGVLFVGGGFWVAHISEYVITSGGVPGAPANPMHGQTVVRETGAWLDNYAKYPGLWLVPLAGVLGMFGCAVLNFINKPIIAWWVGLVGWLGAVFTTGVSMFPFLMPSTTTPDNSLTIWNATGSEYNLAWMLAFTVFFVPAIWSYTIWCVRVMRGKVKIGNYENDTHSY